jgi:YVTN family beta-propeller protein
VWIFSCLLLTSLEAFGSTTRVVAGQNPDFVAVNSATNTVYVSNSNDGTVSVIDGSTNQKTATITVGGMPQGIAVNPVTNMVYVALFAGTSSTVTVIDGSDNSIVTTLSDSGATYVAVDSSSNRIYTSDSDSTVRVIDGSTNTVAATVTFNSVLEGIAVDPVRSLVYVEEVGLPPSVAVIDGSTNTVTNTISVSQASFLTGLAVDSSLDRIYASDSQKMRLFFIDGASGKVLGSVGLPGAGNPKYAALGRGHEVLVTDPGANHVFAVNGMTGKLDTTLNVSYAPWGAQTNPVRGVTYVALSQAVYVEVLAP